MTNETTMTVAFDFEGTGDACRKLANAVAKESNLKMLQWGSHRNNTCMVITFYVTGESHPVTALMDALSRHHVNGEVTIETKCKGERNWRSITTVEAVKHMDQPFCPWCFDDRGHSMKPMYMLPSVGADFETNYQCGTCSITMPHQALIQAVIWMAKYHDIVDSLMERSKWFKYAWGREHGDS